MSESKDSDKIGPEGAQKLTLEEYKETLATLRHLHQLSWTILGLGITAALGLWAYTFKDLMFFSSKSLALAGLGVIVLVLARLMARRMTDYTTSYWTRAEQLEKVLGFQQLSGMRKRMPKPGAPRVNLLLNLIAIVAVIGWFAYLVAFVSHS